MKSVLFRLGRWLPMVFLSSLCVSCLGPSDNLQRFDHSASSPTPQVLIVSHPIKHSHYSYPAGRYIAVLTDSKGTYYEATEKVIQDSVLGGGVAVRTGGFYFPFSRPLHIHSYIMLGAPYKVGGEVTDLTYRFERWLPLPFGTSRLTNALQRTEAGGGAVVPSSSLDFASLRSLGLDTLSSRTRFTHSEAASLPLDGYFPFRERLRT